MLTGLVTAKALVTAGGGTYTLTAQLYETLNNAIPAGIVTGAASCSLFVYGSEFPKGSQGMSGAIEPGVTTHKNSPIILKDNYELSGSDVCSKLDGLK